MIKFMIRDDDTCFFTKPEDIESIYGRFWDKIPVSLSIVPFHGCTRSGVLPEKYWQGEELFPLEKNLELVSFLKEKIKNNRISAMLHGYNHKNSDLGYEFQVPIDLTDKVKEGKQYLESILGTSITTFVPPHNSLSRKGYLSVINNRLNILGVFSFLHIHPVWEKSNIQNACKYHFFKLGKSLSSGEQVKYPFLVNYPTHSELECYSLIPGTTLDSLKKGFEFVRNYNGVFCLTTHYWEIQGETLRTLESFLTYVMQIPNVKFCNDKEIFH